MTVATKNKHGRQTSASGADLGASFAEVRGLLEKHAWRFVVRGDAKGGYHLWSEKPIVIDGRKKKDVYFAGVIPQKGYVGFYFMPVYTNPEQKALFGPELLALLKGKSCFHVRRIDPVVKRQIKDALAAGYRLYRERGWV